ncbi:hypothetical protein [Gluconacetobacter sacchari]|uniref:Uncharacterized protein n=1 Tax=Gluconacetobacter sacchari TaxID=92759 RepID=A0A7W4ICJ3_9PROT|nr:hypothetical protein [Gluconacetobacter sacchari]MBB2160307.1 hypothetical protein [Gluconacetobacter sacchari]
MPSPPRPPDFLANEARPDGKGPQPAADVAIVGFDGEDKVRSESQRMHAEIQIDLSGTAKQAQYRRRRLEQEDHRVSECVAQPVGYAATQFALIKSGPFADGRRIGGAVNGFIKRLERKFAPIQAYDVDMQAEFLKKRTQQIRKPLDVGALVEGEILPASQHVA